ncbi:MAG: hypothetical protein SGILL_006116 [Bacillariaceae sp.]
MPPVPPVPPLRLNSMAVSARDTDVSSRPALVRSNSFTGTRYTAPKVAMKIHRHLLDQHLLGKSAVKDDNGNMVTPPVSLSTDFFHPYFSFLSNSNDQTRQSVRQTNSGESLVETENLVGAAAVASASADIADTDTANTHPSSVPNIETDESDSEEEDGMVGPRPLLMEPNPLRGEDAMDMELQDRAVQPPFPPMPPPDMPGRSTTDAFVSPLRFPGGISCQDYRDVLNSVELNIYSASIGSSKKDEKTSRDLVRDHLKIRFGTYQRRLEKHLSKYDTTSFEECILDFWDEFLPQTASILYYDKHTAVPRLSCLNKFLTTPCPKAIGTVQCEIERIKVGSKKKGVNMKGRFFPTYEYRLFIRHRPADPGTDSDETETEDSSPRRDTVLMMAKNKGRKCSESSGTGPASASSKKGANNYFLHLPQQEDVDLHYKGVNQGSLEGPAPNGVQRLGDIPGSSSLKTRINRRVSAADAVDTKREVHESYPSFLEEEDGAITYTANLLGSRPRIMDVCIPKVDSNGTGTEWKRYLEHSEETDDNAAVSVNRMLNHLKQLQQRGEGDDWTIDNNNSQAAAGTNDDNSNNNNDNASEVGYSPPDNFGLIALQNRPPWWNVELGSFVLNFGGRVSVASVKNFQLCDRSDQEYIMLQFGRIQGRHSFTMDFQYPLTGVQAFAIAISSLQSKISFG